MQELGFTTEEDEGAQREENSFVVLRKQKIKNPPSVPPHPPLCLCGESYS
jgi:hypothetical protein